MSVEALQRLGSEISRMAPVRWSGSVLRVTGNLVESAGPYAAVGDACEIVGGDGRRFFGEIVGFRGRTTLSMTLESPTGIRFGDGIVGCGHRPSIGVGSEMLGRVVDADGKPLDGGSPCRTTHRMEIERAAPRPFERVPIREPLATGIRALDAFVTCGRGQRLGIFGGSGVGKSTLLGMMARGTGADVIVLALVGERGREVAEFLEVLGEEGRRRSVLIVSTSNESPLLRLRAPLVATAVAESFAADGKDVLLVVDSVTRFAMAQREIGLAAGEPPTAKGYTPSVLNRLACLVERAGRFKRGSITGFYSVLMEGDDHQDPVVDTVRSLLDGHIFLDRSLTSRGQYPPISILDSLSRLMSSIADADHLNKAKQLRALLAAYTQSEDLVRLGAYQKGTDSVLDRALEVVPALKQYLAQSSQEVSSYSNTLAMLHGLPG